MKKNEKIFIAGHRGMVGSALVRTLKEKGYSNLALRSHLELDLTVQEKVYTFFKEEHPDYVFLAAAQVGGILANTTYRAEFIYSNLAIQNNVLDAAWKYNVKRLMFLGSSCIYPKHCPQPIKESYLLTGPLETTNESYAIAKIAGLKTCEAYNYQYKTDYVTVMPTNLFGPNDNFEPETSHVMPALIQKIHQAKISKAKHVTIWGTGSPKREFLHVDDMASACVFLMEKESFKDIINIGSGFDLTIRELAEMICKIIGFTGELNFDTSKPDGPPRKLLDISRLQSLGWQPKFILEDSIASTYSWFLENYKTIKAP
jgi:GDP-L-fucose synthase